MQLVKLINLQICYDGESYYRICNEICLFFVYDIYILKMEDYCMDHHDHVFKPSCIERMEMILLEGLGWHLWYPTPYYYIQLLGLKLECFSIEEAHQDQEEEAHANDVLMAKIKEFVVEALLDYRAIHFKPSLIALSSICCSLDSIPPIINSQSSISYFMGLFNQHHKVYNLINLPI